MPAESLIFSSKLGFGHRAYDSCTAAH